MAACARQTGVPYAVLKRAKRQGAPGFHASGRMELRPVLEWLFATDHNTPGTLDPDEAWKQARAERERFRLERDKGMHYDAEKFDEAITGVFRQMMAELVRRFTAVAPGEAAHKKPAEVRKVLEGHLEKFSVWAQGRAEKLAKGEVAK